MGKGTKRHTFPVIKEVRGEGAMCSAGNTAKDSVTSHGHRQMVVARFLRWSRIMYINAEPLCRTPETTTVL